MTVRRVMGIETEYAVSNLSHSHANPVQLSFDVVNGASGPFSSTMRWDYSHEDPVNDARGHRLERARAHPDILTDDVQLQITNVAQANGSRIYVDHAHPEYSSAEVCDPFDAVIYGRAGDILMQKAAQKASAVTSSRILLYRNNVDGKGASWGSHENYQVKRSVNFDFLSRLFMTFAVSRQIFTGSGRVGIGEKSETAGFQISQRADYFHMKVGLQTTFDRPIVNTRDESHSTDTWRRFHVIVGDANRMDVPEVLKIGTTSMVLWLAEQLSRSSELDQSSQFSQSAAENEGSKFNDLLYSVELADPVQAMHIVSHDLTLREPLALESGGTTTAWVIQVKLRTAVYSTAAEVYGTNSVGEPLWPDDSTRRIMQMWGDVLGDLAHVAHCETDNDRLKLADEASHIEWLLKWQILEQLRRRRGTDWSDARLKAADISWGSIDDSSIFNAVKKRAKILFTSEQIQHAAENPPEDTRAWLRGNLVREFPELVAAVTWSAITLRNKEKRPVFTDSDAPSTSRGQSSNRSHSNLSTLENTFTVIHMDNPLKFTRAEIGDILSAGTTITTIEGIKKALIH